MTQPELADDGLRNIDGMPERPREDPAAAVDALERKVERELGPEPTGEGDLEHGADAVAEDADLPDPVEESEPARCRDGVEPPD